MQSQCKLATHARTRNMGENQIWGNMGELPSQRTSRHWQLAPSRPKKLAALLDPAAAAARSPATATADTLEGGLPTEDSDNDAGDGAAPPSDVGPPSGTAASKGDAAAAAAEVAPTPPSNPTTFTPFAASWIQCCISWICGFISKRNVLQTPDSSSVLILLVHHVFDAQSDRGIRR